MKYTLFLIVLVVSVGCGPSEPVEVPVPALTEQDRNIKALTEQEVEGYLTGEAMGLATVAEHNQHPSPRNVLALADELGLEEGQRRRVQRIAARLQADAIALGEKIVAKERELDLLFAGQQAEDDAVDTLVRESGELQIALRLAHLQAHLDTKALLTAEQIAHYDQLRGLDAWTPPGQGLPAEEY